MAQNNYDFAALENATVYDSESKKLGTVSQVYLNNTSGQPEFVTINTGLFGTRETFVPIDATQKISGDLVVPFTKAFVKDAPQVDADGGISVEEEQELLRYYSTNGRSASTSKGDTRNDRGAGQGTRGGTGRTDDTTDDGQMVAHEERLRVDKQSQEVGQARLRKRVRTETEHVEVPVQREELVVERETIDPNSKEARSAGVIDDSAETEEVVTLREERAVVSKETVATEKVNVGKRTVEDTESVDAKVRKEEIEIDESDSGRS